MTRYHAVWLILVIIYPAIDCTADVEVDREEKLISTFQIVRFPNDVCIGSSSRNGTCYTSAECSNKGGTSSGSCADGFGVCCVFLITACGSSTSENNTYWTQPSTVSAGTCALTVCPISDDICSIRLDFTTFTITGPSTLTTATLSRLRGAPYGTWEEIALAAYGANDATNCLLDSFTATGPSPSSTPPVICGVNTGFHMYTEADVDRCNTLTFTLAEYAGTAVGVTNSRGVVALATRAWDITATQIECASATLPPAGCTQYFYGSGVATLRTYNHQSTTVGTANLHLANQHQRICIRRERGKCLGCFYTDADGFAVSGRNEDAVHYSGQGICCAYQSTQTDMWGITDEESILIKQADNIGTHGFDCVVIPGAFSIGNSGGIAKDVYAAQTSALLSQLLSDSPTANAYPTPSGPQICGNQNSIGIGAANFEKGVYDSAETDYEGTAVDNTICSRIAPYVLEFISDDIESGGSIVGEFNSATHAPNQGFIISHNQIDC